MAQNSSNDESKSVTVKQSLLNNCNKALDELEAYDKLLAAKETEIKVLQERLDLEKEKFQVAVQLSETRKRQAEVLIEANNALKEALSIKEKVIENQSKEIEILKKKGSKLSTIAKAIGIGIGIGLLLK